MDAPPFPVFLDLRRRPCLVVGSGIDALRRVERLCAAGARVELVAGTAFAPARLEGAALVMVAGVDLAIAEAVSAAAQARGIPINVMDEPRLCSFLMPAVVERAPVVVAVSTGGASPTLAQLLRERIEAVLPERIGVLARLAGRFRPLVAARLPDYTARRRFWRAVLTGRIAALALAGNRAAAGAALRDALDAAAEVRDAA
jgi:uroporphyrin-III C-methyltransferase/precorrin-2 dehydrogenase/sirohydrochlorin ferrochelatase